MPKFKIGQKVFVKMHHTVGYDDEYLTTYTIGVITYCYANNRYNVLYLGDHDLTENTQEVKPYHEDWVGKKWEDL